MDKPKIFQILQQIKSPLFFYFYGYGHRIIIGQKRAKVYWIERGDKVGAYALRTIPYIPAQWYTIPRRAKINEILEREEGIAMASEVLLSIRKKNKIKILRAPAPLRESLHSSFV
jgi:hypothetical protein